MKKIIPSVLLSAVLGASVAMPLMGWAQSTDNHDHTHGAAQAALTDGEVRKVDAETGKVTIRHAEIRHLEMPPMTMVFTARDKSLLTNVKAGDKVRFMVVNEGGKIVLTEIQPVP